MRNFTSHEVAAFISECFNVHPAECEDDGAHFTFAELNIDRDKFDEELQWYANENRIPLDYGAFTYKTDEMDDCPIEILVVKIPYTEAR